MRLAGKRVLVTGASRGIGAALAREFAARGATVALVARDGDAVAKLAADLGGTAHPADLTDPDQVRSLVERVESAAGPVDLLVNNAGVEAAGPFAELDPDDLEDLVRLNLLTPAELCRQAIPRMLGRGGGHILNVSSMSGLGVFPGLVAYSASKAGLTHLTAGLRADLKGLPIGTTVVELGPVRTDMLDRIDRYEPARRSFSRGNRLQLVPESPLEPTVRRMVDAVERGRRHVRVPRRMVGFSLLAEAPRRITELLLTGVRPRESGR